MFIWWSSYVFQIIQFKRYLAIEYYFDLTFKQTDNKNLLPVYKSFDQCDSPLLPYSIESLSVSLIEDRTPPPPLYFPPPSGGPLWIWCERQREYKTVGWSSLNWLQLSMIWLHMYAREKFVLYSRWFKWRELCTFEAVLVQQIDLSMLSLHGNPKISLILILLILLSLVSSWPFCSFHPSRLSMGHSA
jgi:hypothetical protein